MTTHYSLVVLLLLMLWLRLRLQAVHSLAVSKTNSSSNLTRTLLKLSQQQQQQQQHCPMMSSSCTEEKVQWVHRTEPVASTQDEARQLLSTQQQQQQQQQHASSTEQQLLLAVVADTQTAGRGTQGRQWQGADVTGNLYLTVAVPVERIPVTLTLLPLQVGVLVTQRVRALLVDCREKKDMPPVTVKWPNDVLIGDAKVSGTLIESHTLTTTANGNDDSNTTTTWLLIGVGINLVHRPDLRGLPGKHARSATAVQEWCANDVPLATAVGWDLAQALRDWVFADNKEMTRAEKESRVIEEWKELAGGFGKVYELRGAVVDEEAGGYQGEKVTTLAIERDGQLRVRGANGRERLLSAEYVF